MSKTKKRGKRTPRGNGAANKGKRYHRWHEHKTGEYRCIRRGCNARCTTYTVRGGIVCDYGKTGNRAPKCKGGEIVAPRKTPKLKPLVKAKSKAPPAPKSQTRTKTAKPKAKAA